MGEPMKGQAATEQAPSSGGEARLRRNAVGLTGTVIMSAAIMGPAVSTFFNPQFSTPFSGFATPFVYLVTLIVTLIVASGIMEMARVAPSAGSFYTYITRSLGPRAGFITGGLMFVAYALLAPIEIGLIGGYLQETFKQEFNVNIPWIWIGIVPAALMAVLAFEGITTSLKTALALFTAEVVVVVGLSLIIVAKGGAHGLTLAPLSPTSSSHGFSGLVTGFVFAALSFVGFEGATALGDEAKRPHRTIPKGDPAVDPARRSHLPVRHYALAVRARQGQDECADRRGPAVEHAGRHLRALDEMARDHRIGVQHVRGDDQLEQRDRPHHVHHGTGEAASRLLEPH